MFIRSIVEKSLVKVLFGVLVLLSAAAKAQEDRAILLTAAHEYMAQDSSKLAVDAFEWVVSGDRGQTIVDSLSGVALHNLGVLAYYADGYPQAVEYFRRAVELRDEVFGGRPHNERAHSRSNLASMYRMVGKLDSTAIRIREATQIYGALPEVDSLNWLRSLNELGALAFSQENYLMGYSSSYRAVRLSGEMAELDPYDAFVTHYRAARILLRLGKKEEALPLAHRAVEIAADLQEPVDHADALNLLAIVQREMGDREGSRHSLREAIELPLDRRQDAFSLAFIYANLAGLDSVRTDYDREARKLFTQADELREYYLLDQLPENYYQRAEYEAALAHLDEAIAFLTGRTPNALTVDQLRNAMVDIVPVASLTELRARTLTALERRKEAIKAYDLLFSVQDLLRESVSDYASRSYYSKNLRPSFERAIALYYAEYRESADSSALWRAFTLSERARAYSLLATLQPDRTKGEVETQLLDRIAHLERALSLGKQQAGDELTTARLELERLYFQQQDQLPRLPPTLDHTALVDYLGREGCTLLEYHLGEEVGLLFSLSGDGRLRVYPIDSIQQLTEWVNDFRAVIEGSKYRRKSLRSAEEQSALDRRFLESGTLLADQLLPPVVRNSGRLCIVPDGSLHYLPFAALPLSITALPLDYGAVDYLHRRAELRFAYSGSYLLQVAGQTANTFATQLTAFAPTFGSDNSAMAENRSGAREVLRSGAALSPLRFNVPEVEEVTALLAGAEAFTGARASKQAFLNAVGHSRILHLSSHGTVDSQDPNLSFIAFSQEGGLDREELLYFNDLYRLPLSNDLTILSACETNLGQLAAGETTMSMASAFAAAGARSTVTTLWQVDDEATKDVIVAFYRQLVSGDTRAAALHAAQSGLIATGDYAHPYYWSGLTLYGMGGTLPLTANAGNRILPWWGWLIVVGLLAGLLAYFFKFLYDARPVLRKEKGA